VEKFQFGAPVFPAEPELLKVFLRKKKKTAKKKNKINK